MKTRKHKISRNKTLKIYAIPSVDKDIKAIIDIDAIRHNVHFLKHKTGTDIMPVLKADAYGHGLVEMARHLRIIGITYIGVATLGEAILLRNSGDKGRVLAWLYDIEGLMSHLVCSEIKNSPIVNEQLRKFREIRTRLAEINIFPPLVHIANTGGCFNYDVSDFTLSRSGSGIYGISGKDKYDKHLKLAMTVKSYIIQLKYVNKGEGIGYNWKYITPKKMRVAVLPIGYADIIPRSASGKLYVYINGTKRKILGLISMDQIIVEAKEIDKVNDDNVFIFGNGKNCLQTIFDVANKSNSLPIEILCHVGYRINRIYNSTN